MKILICLLVLAITLAVKAENTEALQNYVSNFGGYGYGTSGWTFQPLTNVSVTALGCFDYVLSYDQSPSPDYEPISVGLWAADGTLLASNVVTTNSPLISQTRYEPIDPVLLSTNETYYLGACSSLGVMILYGFFENGPGYVNMAPEIQLGTAVNSTNLSLTFPGSMEGHTGTAIIAPNFEFQDGILPPVLNITLTNNDVLISWSATYTGYSLQENNNFTATNWVTTTNSVVSIGGQNQVLIPLPSNNNFYRIKSQ